MKTKLCASPPNPQEHSRRAYPITNSKINDKAITPSTVPYGYHYHGCNCFIYSGEIASALMSSCYLFYGIFDNITTRMQTVAVSENHC